MNKVIGFLLLLMLVTLSGCDLIGDIFGAGFYTGIFVVVVVIILIIYIIVRVGRRK